MYEGKNLVLDWNDCCRICYNMYRINVAFIFKNKIFESVFIANVKNESEPYFLNFIFKLEKKT